MQRSPTQPGHTAYMFYLLCSAAAVKTADPTTTSPINAAGHGTLTFDTLQVTIAKTPSQEPTVKAQTWTGL